MMSVETDFDAATAAQLRDELERFGHLCRYDPALRKIVYRCKTDALHVYMTLQVEEMERHKWIESEKACCDLRDGSLAEWVARHSAAFSRQWKKTHTFVPAGQTRPPGKPARAV